VLNTTFLDAVKLCDNFETTLLCNLQLVFYQYIFILANFTKCDRKQDCVWLYFNKTKGVGKAGCRAKCKKCRDLSSEWSSIMILAHIYTQLISVPLIYLQLLSIYQVKSNVLHLQSHYHWQRCRNTMQWLSLTLSRRQVQVRKQPSTIKLCALSVLPIIHAPSLNTHNLSNSCQCFARVTSS